MLTEYSRLTFFPICLSCAHQKPIPSLSGKQVVDKVRISLSLQISKIYKTGDKPESPAIYLPDKFVSSCAVLDADVCLKAVTFDCPHPLSSNLPKGGELTCQPNSPDSSKNDILSQTSTILFISQEYMFSTNTYLVSWVPSYVFFAKIICCLPQFALTFIYTTIAFCNFC